jgi:hypothetical protein
LQALPPLARVKLRGVGSHAAKATREHYIIFYF